MRTVLALVLLTAPAWASPPKAPPAAAKPKPAPVKKDLVARAEVRRAEAAPSTLTLEAPPKRSARPSRRVTLPDWQP